MSFVMQMNKRAYLDQLLHDIKAGQRSYSLEGYSRESECNNDKLLGCSRVVLESLLKFFENSELIPTTIIESPVFNPIGGYSLQLKDSEKEIFILEVSCHNHPANDIINILESYITGRKDYPIVYHGPLAQSIFYNKFEELSKVEFTTLKFPNLPKKHIQVVRNNFGIYEYVDENTGLSFSVRHIYETSTKEIVRRLFDDFEYYHEEVVICGDVFHISVRCLISLLLNVALPKKGFNTNLSNDAYKIYKIPTYSTFDDLQYTNDDIKALCGSYSRTDNYSRILIDTYQGIRREITKGY